IRVPFDTPKYAEIAYRVLSVDQEPRRNFVQKTLSLESDVLVVHFKADQVKNLRTAITSFFECLLLCQDTIKQFGETEENNAGTQSSTDTA
ncbi:CG42498, partial [Drosophila busckii]